MNKILNYLDLVKVWWTTRRSEIFDSNRARYTFYAPTDMKFDHRAVEYLREMQLQHWNPGELDFSRDLHDFNNLPVPLQKTIENLLAFFAFGDGVVDEIIEHVKMRIKIPEVRAFYPAQEESEIVHGQTYGDMLSTFVPCNSRRDEILNNIGHTARLDRKLKWIAKWTNPRLPLAVLVCAMLIIEQVWFSTAFNIINWLRVLNQMPEMVKANEFIIRNETLHGEYASYVLLKYFNFRSNVPLKRVFDRMLEEAKDAEVSFIHAISNTYKYEIDECYRGLHFEILYDHLLVTISTMKNQLLIHDIRMKPNIAKIDDADSLQLPILTALGVGKDNFFEYNAPNYQNPTTTGEDSINDIITKAFE